MLESASCLGGVGTFLATEIPPLAKQSLSKEVMNIMCIFFVCRAKKKARLTSFAIRTMW
jgi:hypothetical protein